ncbi:hypothetical protein IM53_001910 [Xanthomonas phaseoli pv. dieffenbachiae]|uniref:Uncharacterized protein n=1 Tax=Xanthomonas phaseoli pv. dieffenbachiae TaxID=92828 RepID=A0A1V9HHY6_9XANT|nr:hypothetical protein IM53_001910 [Xanthomonas phaseoli pv. dieffenbachiae]
MAPASYAQHLANSEIINHRLQTRLLLRMGDVGVCMGFRANKKKALGSGSARGLAQGVASARKEEEAARQRVKSAQKVDLTSFPITQDNSFAKDVVASRKKSRSCAT